MGGHEAYLKAINRDDGPMIVMQMDMLIERQMDKIISAYPDGLDWINAQPRKGFERKFREVKKIITPLDFADVISATAALHRLRNEIGHIFDYSLSFDKVDEIGRYIKRRIDRNSRDSFTYEHLRNHSITDRKTAKKIYDEIPKADQKIPLKYFDKPSPDRLIRLIAPFLLAAWESLAENLVAQIKSDTKA